MKKAQEIVAHLPKAELIARQQLTVLAHHQGETYGSSSRVMKSDEHEKWKATVYHELEQLKGISYSNGTSFKIFECLKKTQTMS